MLKKNYKNRIPFRSYTDINNYNNFLLELDKKNLTSTNLTNLSIKKLSDTNLVNTKSNYKKEHIKIFVKENDKTFTKLGYGDPNFTGIHPLDALLAAIEQHLDTDKKETINMSNTNNTNNIPIIDKKNVNINTEVNNITDLLQLIDLYPDDNAIEYNINISRLHKIKQPLIELNNMIGMKDLKQNIVDQIIFYIQNLHTINSNNNNNNNSSNDFMHTIIYGPPGTGKTEIAKIIGSIFSKMGILTKGTFKKVTRADLIAGYLGQTAIKTRDIIKECLGGVLFIDEAYALGNEEKKDSFSKECIDTLCEALSDHKDNLMVIIAGYENSLNNCFFNYNPGLQSRFTWRFKTDEYNAQDLYKIFIKKVNDGGWSLAEDSAINVKWFEKNKSHFKYYGRDIETLFAKTKIAHSRRVFCLDPSVKKLLTIKDIDKGLEIYLKNEFSDDKDKELNKIIHSMYV
jgi:ATP-dependent 26S proteasome regulatory subunit